jgi:hypothetical protein
MTLTIGDQYKKADFGIGRNVQRWSEITVRGELFSFFSKDNRYDNIIEEDGFVYECRGEYGLIPYGVKSDLHRHVFIHDTANKPHTYLGKGVYEKRYDDKRNKIYFKEE